MDNSSGWKRWVKRNVQMLTFMDTRFWRCGRDPTVTVIRVQHRVAQAP
jgi:hypothetical protein